MPAEGDHPNPYLCIVCSDCLNRHLQRLFFLCRELLRGRVALLLLLDFRERWFRHGCVSYRRYVGVKRKRCTQKEKEREMKEDRRK